MSQTFHMPRRVQFAETDLAGVLHFANYFRMMEEAEHAFWRSLDLGVMLNDGERTLSWPRVNATCDYMAPAHFEDQLTLGVRLTKLGSRSLIFEIEFTRGEDRLAVGRFTTVCCAMAAGQFSACEIPPGIRSVLEPYVHAD